MNSACVFCIDDAYVMPFQVFFHSLEDTCSIPTSASLFILHTAELSSVSIAMLQSYLSGYGRSASFLDATALIPADLPIRPGDHVSPATFYRLFIAEILPSNIDQAVYLDADMLALRSIAPLFNEPVQDLVAAVDHCSPADGFRLWGEHGGTYFQAGVLVIPLQTWREQNILQKFLDVMANEQDRIQWWDQDVLNIALRDRWQRLPIWCNVCEAVHRALPMPLIEAQAALIHYSGSSKPWNAYKPSPFTAQWDLGYEAAFRQPFNREALRPPRPPLPTRLKAAVRSRISGLVHGRR
ncbi:MAG: glycosyltransferase family 8 protein [Chitinophagaceae bacterium]|nr:glycosyltransferase family 8 protein [Chitinophagaceae bacterium]